MSYGEIKTTINSKVGTAEFKPLNELIYDNFATLSDWLANGGASKVVKSVQRGYVDTYELHRVEGYTKNISLNTINPNKALVILDFAQHNKPESYTSYIISAYKITLTENSLHVYQEPIYHDSPYYTYLAFNWQVIEFY